MLSLCPRSEIAIGGEGLVFALEDVNACVARVIICKSDVVVSLLRSKDLKVRLAQNDIEWRCVFYPSIIEGDADC